ncbi:hypothetical protein [Streptomyces albireticuli]|uniref:Uncharacterized protein n=1 Tax=Streptomyces albireticuli TaxID=1940 RepID=A0A2A2D7M2_9ACTN|nr:hypothetical protein [Streptomyces albireticuli]MCD9144360.1 hypothetical protein [Streptomyces albireticuli]MCD9161997.1 hypothetical protein [Streptomyces albireticuli]MCD9193997.1 hypothetical protein [Streptomyces albireticuli]PAU47515.1 hypothetical protein CK936_18135 [Streptomyces albireticuli]
MKLRHVRLPAAAVVGAVLALAIDSRLRSYGVSVSLSVTCALAVFANTSAAINHLVEIATATTHRCKVPGCTFRVRLPDADPVESRRWQEAAAAHPAHTPARHS